MKYRKISEDEVEDEEDDSSSTGSSLLTHLHEHTCVQ